MRLSTHRTFFLIVCLHGFFSDPSFNSHYARSSLASGESLCPPSDLLHLFGDGRTEIFCQPRGRKFYGRKFLVGCSLRVVGGATARAKNLGVLSNSDGKNGNNRTLVRNNVAQLSIYRSVYVPTLSRGQVLSFLWTVAGHSRRDRGRSSDIQREIGAEPLLRGGRSQLRWFRIVIKMPPGCLHLALFQARPSGRRPRGGPRRDRWRDPPGLAAPR